MTSRLQRLGAALRRVRLSVIVPLVVGLGLLAFVAYAASARNSGQQLADIVSRTWPAVLLLTFPYLAAEALVWHELLEQLDVRVRWRPMLVAFAGGEITKSLPVGVFLQNYLLGRLTHLGEVSIVRSTTATFAMLGLQSLIAVPVLLIVGIKGQSWVFWTVLGIVIAWLAIIGLITVLVRFLELHLRQGTHPALCRWLGVVDEFLTAGAQLATRRTLKNLVPTAFFMLVYVIDLYIILRAAGVHSITFLDTMSIYAATSLAVILVPIPTEIGITEFTGLGALLAYGVARPTAAVVMISLRLLATGFTILVAGVALIFLRGELAAAERERESLRLPVTE